MTQMIGYLQPKLLTIIISKNTSQSDDFSRYYLQDPSFMKISLNIKPETQLLSEIFCSNQLIEIFGGFV